MTRDLGNRTYLIDTGLYRPRHSACYLVEDHGELAIIDTGTQHALPQVLSGIAQLGATPAQVRYVIPTHVHLDHAGGSGHLMHACAEATLLVHPRGLQHMIDPARLQSSAQAVYGTDAFARDFGVLLPVEERRCAAATDGLSLELGSRRLQILDTPGHANHHNCVFDEFSGFLYTGDSFGLGYSEFNTIGRPLLLATTTPVAFDPDAWMHSLDRMMDCHPSACCLTHFGKLDDPESHVEMLRESIQAHAAIGLHEEKFDPQGRELRLRQAVSRLFMDAVRAHGGVHESQAHRILAADIELNAQGLAVWLARRAKRAA